MDCCSCTSIKCQVADPYCVSTWDLGMTNFDMKWINRYPTGKYSQDFVIK